MWNEASKVFLFLSKTVKMRSEWEIENSRSWRESKTSTGRNTCPTSKAELEESNQGAPMINEDSWGAVPDVFQVAVRGLSPLLLGGQVQLLRELPQSGSVEDPCERRQRRQRRHSVLSPAQQRSTDVIPSEQHAPPRAHKQAPV